MLYHRQVVRDEQICQSELLLKIPEQIDDLCLDRDIESRNGLITEYELGRTREDNGSCATPEVRMPPLPW